MAAKFVQDGCTIDYTPDADVALGAVVVVNDLVGVAQRAIPANTMGTLALEGVFDVPKEAATPAVEFGAMVYWDAPNNAATPSATGNVQLGPCVKAAGADDLTLRVRLTP